MAEIPAAILADTNRSYGSLSQETRRSFGQGVALRGNPAGQRVHIQLVNEQRLTRDLRILSRGKDPRGIALQKELASATSMLNRRVRKALIDEIPRGNYRVRRRGQRRVLAADNARFVSYGPYGRRGERQPSGLLRKSVRIQKTRNRTRIVIGSDAAFYTRPLLEHNDFVWRVQRQEFPRILREYERAFNRVAEDFNRIWGNTNLRSGYSVQRSVLQRR